MASTESKKDEVKQGELQVWEAAVRAAKLRAHRPTPGDVLTPWAYGSAAGTANGQVCTLNPFPAANRITLFLRTRLPAAGLMHELNKDFFGHMKHTVEVGEICTL